jgi:hypothetical protein
MGIGFLSWGVKRPVGEADKLLPSSVDVENVWINIAISLYAFMV